ncbi:hypothetical protein L0156_07890, partial [bacterium]|nr:hypothetical protein [bacterium]
VSRNRITELEDLLRQLDVQRKKIAEELSTLRSQELARTGDLPRILGTAACSKTPQTAEEKIQLFLTLFRCRESVYPKLWHNQKEGD